MDASTLIFLAALMGCAAALYASVGHGGASAYLALMALFGVPAVTMRPVALVLNIIVSGFASWRYLRAGQFDPRLFLAFAAAAIPMAFLGGRIDVGEEVYRPMVGAVLWAAAVPLLLPAFAARLAERPTRRPPLWISLPAGAAIGLLAGLTGTGGGIFLSPLIIYFGWQGARETSGVAAAFILVNSLAGLAGNVSGFGALPAELPVLAAAVLAGAVLGTALGVSRLPRRRLLQALGLVLVIAGAKLIFQ